MVDTETITLPGVCGERHVVAAQTYRRPEPDMRPYFWTRTCEACGAEMRQMQAPHVDDSPWCYADGRRERLTSLLVAYGDAVTLSFDRVYLRSVRTPDGTVWTVE